jgi:uncharacterized protein (UPF0264 family)
LVSVRNVVEALAALRGGADWIDLKEPARGALGAVSAAVARDVASCVAGRAPISAAAGELSDWARGESRELMDVEGLSILKLGLAGCRERAWEAAWRAARDEIAAQGKSLAAVIYADSAAADSPDARAIVRVAQHGRAGWVLLDTYDKSACSVVKMLAPDELRELLEVVRQSGLKSVVAGRLDIAAIPELPLELVEMVAVRGAACQGGRAGKVCEGQVAALRQLLAAN